MRELTCNEIAEIDFVTGGSCGLACAGLFFSYAGAIASVVFAPATAGGSLIVMSISMASVATGYASVGQSCSP